MYAYIKGTIVNIFENGVIVENNGIGYFIGVSSTTISDIGGIGHEVKLLTYQHVREDEITLYGFFKEEEKNMFLMLITITGIGPKMAMQILSNISYINLSTAIAKADIKMLSTIKGIGKKTAERIVVELKDKISSDFEIENLSFTNKSFDKNSDANDAIEALVSLGYSQNESKNAVLKALGDDATNVNDIIKVALKYLYRG